MKKVILLSFAIFALLGSCTTEKEPTITTENVEVSFALDLQSIPSTRAISDGTGATQLSYGVFNDSGELVIGKVVKNDVTTLLSQAGHTMTISLAKGQSYNVVFWAQNPQCSAYTVSDDMQLTIDYQGVNNDELRDAFFGVTETFKVENNLTVSVVLKRPFAQVNVGAFPFDLEHVKELGVDIAASSATVKGVANQLNLLTGEATGEVEVNYSLNAIPTEDLAVDVDENGVNETYSYLSMSYLLASPEPTTHSMSFVFAEADGSCPADFSNGLDFVPIQRNWRTNIVGQILTGEVSFNVKIDPIYEGQTLNSGGLYYNFSEDTIIKDKFFAFNTNEAATFTSENNTLIAFEDVTFSGRIQYIAVGEYRDKGSYVKFTNTLKNVKAENMVVDHPGIHNVRPIDFMAPLFFFRGVNTIEDCVFTGTTTTANLYEDNFHDFHPVIAYDCGVPNGCEATFNNCQIDNLYAWSHSQITLNNTNVKYIRCSTHLWSESSSHLTIGAGSVVDEIFVTSSNTDKRQKDEAGQWHWVDLPSNWWSPSLIIKAGAHVKRLDMNGRTMDDTVHNVYKQTVIIEEGAIVDEIVNLATE